ncbi:hypothetical protein EXIGLDRAFT_439673 [Exidia glandulosa HHB12029]|uniref:Uncharacterized protein n=1 Tax=Exidia glandulosa HHB12029 TaxID=1314781 RepID=A0A165B7T9_EXIGL|nr:hypothetical protein EXIGLDRAFT_439673 [Exidia glandulosa HHB12029]
MSMYKVPELLQYLIVFCPGTVAFKGERQGPFVDSEHGARRSSSCPARRFSEAWISSGERPLCRHPWPWGRCTGSTAFSETRVRPIDSRLRRWLVLQCSLR